LRDGEAVSVVQRGGSISERKRRENYPRERRGKKRARMGREVHSVMPTWHSKKVRGKKCPEKEVSGGRNCSVNNTHIMNAVGGKGMHWRGEREEKNGALDLEDW